MVAIQRYSFHGRAFVKRHQVNERVQGQGRDGVKPFMEQKRLIQISDIGAIEDIVDKVLSQNKQQLQEYCAGKTKLQGFFVGRAPPTAVC